MPEVRFLPDELMVETRAGETLLDAAHRSGIPLVSACGGEAACTTCRVMVVEGVEQMAAPPPEEAVLLAPLGADGSIRLGCRAVPQGPVTVRRLVIDEDDIALTDRRQVTPGPAGREQEVGVLFADLRGFTSFAESLLPYDVVHVLNRFYALAGGVMERHGGTIATYMGDGFMALFGVAPGDGPALRAVRAGLDLIEAVAGWRSYLELLHGRGLQVSVGVHTGRAVVGALGAGPSRIVTAVGDVVNTAARVEQANRSFGTRLLVSDEVARTLGDRLVAAPMPAIPLAGKSGVYRLHAVEAIH
ncbi:MAG TPA: adenylate/guanylate cyclase domain-containing protein [Acidimicrobiia bacterium]|nr:adenylate/guanylate cyclase domain-containing protein [Acidimicrobiia bacterium]